MRERDIETKVKEYARSRGFLVRKFTSPGNRAAPDDIFMRADVYPFFVEFKRPGGRATKAQKREHALYRKAGVDVWIVDDIEFGKEMVDSFGSSNG